AKLHAAKAYDSAEKCRVLRARSITPRVARRGIEANERREDLLQSLLHLAWALICVRFLRLAGYS
ncbi:MAG: hypothetical protein M3121_06975, partial [Chloroflexota bacterium]|nr:hypothetical protein [Chloroflexota bacterium]